MLIKLLQSCQYHVKWGMRIVKHGWHLWVAVGDAAATAHCVVGTAHDVGGACSRVWSTGKRVAVECRCSSRCGTEANGRFRSLSCWQYAFHTPPLSYTDFTTLGYTSRWMPGLPHQLPSSVRRTPVLCHPRRPLDHPSAYRESKTGALPRLGRLAASESLQVGGHVGVRRSTRCA